MIASRVRDEVDSATNAGTRTSDLGHNNMNLKTVAILPVSRNVPIDEFARKLQAALEGIGASTSYLNQASISSHLGRHAFTRMGKLKVRFFGYGLCLFAYSSVAFPSLQDGLLIKNRNTALFYTLPIHRSIALGRRLASDR